MGEPSAGGSGLRGGSGGIANVAIVELTLAWCARARGCAVVSRRGRAKSGARGTRCTRAPDRACTRGAQGINVIFREPYDFSGRAPKRRRSARAPA